LAVTGFTTRFWRVLCFNARASYIKRRHDLSIMSLITRRSIPMFVSRCHTSSLSSLSSSGRRIAVIACVLGAGLLAAPAASQAQAPTTVPPPTIFGSLANFDAVNDTEGEKEGFEIQLEGLEPQDVTRVFGQTGTTCYIRYCGGSVTPYGVPGVTPFGVYVRWNANYDPATQQFTTPLNAPGGGSSGTPSRVLNPHPMPTTGEACWSLGSGTAYPNSGCEHFGVSTLRNPTRTTYRWLTGDPATGDIAPATITVAGVTVPAPPVAIPHPVAAAVVPAGGVQDVQVVVQGLPPIDDNAPLPRRFGKAEWVKVYKTELPRKANLDELVGGHPNNVVPNAQNVAAETEWKLLQFDVTNPDKGSSQLRSGGPTNNGSHSVVRRYEFYQYTGPVVAPGGSSRTTGGTKYSTDDREASLCPRAVPGDVTTGCLSPGPDEVGDFIGAQMAGQNLDGVVVTLGATTGTAGGPVTATIANAPGTAGDWAGLYDANGKCVQWQYLNGTQALPAAGVSSATVTFTLPATPGTYHTRVFNGTYTFVAASGTIATTAPSVTLGATTGTAGGTVTATIANAPGTAGDWAGLYDANGNPVQWQYLNGSHSVPATGVSSATVNFILPATPGAYHVRLYNATYTRVATSGTITTSAPSVTLGATTGTAGGTVTATITNGPGTPGDWIGLYDANGNPMQWQYLNGSHSLPVAGVKSATVTFILPAAPGTYHARLFNGTYTRVATSGTISTSAPSVTLGATTGSAGGTVTATIANAPGTRGDWVGLADANGNWVQWQYLNGSQSLPAAGVTGATVTFALPAPGSYQVRLFNGTYTLVAISETIAVF